MEYEQIARDRLEKLKQNLCSRHFRDIDPSSVGLDVEITSKASPHKIYACTYRNSLGLGYCIEAGLPPEILSDECSFQTLFTAALAHELGHIVKKHPGSCRAGLAVVLGILGEEISPLKKLGGIMIQKIEEEADRVVRERGLGLELDAGAILGKRIKGIV